VFRYVFADTGFEGLGPAPDANWALRPSPSMAKLAGERSGAMTGGSLQQLQRPAPASAQLRPTSRTAAGDGCSNFGESLVACGGSLENEMGTGQLERLRPGFLQEHPAAPGRHLSAERGRPSGPLGPSCSAAPAPGNGSTRPKTALAGRTRHAGRPRRAADPLEQRAGRSARGEAAGGPGCRQTAHRWEGMRTTLKQPTGC